MQGMIVCGPVVPDSVLTAIVLKPLTSIGNLRIGVIHDYWSDSGHPWETKGKAEIWSLIQEL